ncbi:TPA: transposase, partial [Streptococcus suis 89-5259]|nr:transposase [Streptococcus suis 89-5259]
YHGGYLFLQNIYYQLGLDKICQDIQKRYHFSFHLDTILSRLLYGRILFPSSKRSTAHFSQTLLEPTTIELQHLYRGLEIIAKETDFIQEQLYKNSTALSSRKTDVLYYDCTNFYFEIEEEDEEGQMRQYGYSKEHRPNPIVQMGLFMDSQGIPLAFSITPGNTNEQTTMKPLEKK